MVRPQYLNGRSGRSNWTESPGRSKRVDGQSYIQIIIGYLSKLGVVLVVMRECISRDNRHLPFRLAAIFKCRSPKSLAASPPPFFDCSNPKSLAASYGG